MLVDIFAHRYQNKVIRDTFDQRDNRLLVQAFRILSEDICPYYRDGREDKNGIEFWKDLESLISREIGLKELSPHLITFTQKWNGNDTSQFYKPAMVTVCETWMNKPVNGSPDEHIKARLSLIELGFRKKEREIAELNAKIISSEQLKMAGFLNIEGRVKGKSPRDVILNLRLENTTNFQNSVAELNARFHQANYPLNYHNGFIQMSADPLLQVHLENPFWSLVAESKWENVDVEMKQALDLRDSGGQDAAFHAAKALESTMKIVLESRGWTNGKGKSAHNYIDVLASKSNSFINSWESTSLKEFFTHVRNPFGHGAGSAEIPTLSVHQTDWAIEFCMIWIKSLVRRI